MCDMGRTTGGRHSLQQNYQDRERISVSKEELHRMLESDELHKASVLVFANKQDVAGCMTATEISQQLSLQACIASTLHPA